jgi:hypothetical protein
VFDQLDAILGVKRTFELSVCSIEADAMEAAVNEWLEKILETLENK